MGAGSGRDRGTALMWIAAAFLAGSFVSLVSARGAETFRQPITKQPATKPSTAKQPATDAAESAVCEALQREVYGLDLDRQELLSAALSATPDFAPARWQLGEVRAADGQWRSSHTLPDERRLALLAQYEKLRAQAAVSPDGQFELADWCRTHQLPEQERAHLLRVCELAPNHQDARRRLNMVRVGVEWVSREDVAGQQARAAALERAAQTWRPRVLRWAELLQSDMQIKREQARREIAALQDASALPTLQTLLATQSEEAELLVLDVATRMQEDVAAQAFAHHAVFSPSLYVRQVAIARLKKSSRDQFVPQLVAAMYSPVISRVELTALPNGRISYRHEFLREGAERQEHLVLDTEYRRIASPTGDAGRTTLTVLLDAQRVARNLERTVEQQNANTTALNDRIGWVLRETTGVDLPAAPDAWWNWWNDQNEVFVEGSKQVASISQTRRVAVVEEGSLGSTTGRSGGAISVPAVRQDCLAAGTPIWTERGRLAIEKIQVGDLVLSRDVTTGELAYKPVVRTTVRPVGQLVKITAGKESFETSGGHLFWVSGTGWVKSRDLQSGMVLHGSAQPSRVTRVEVGAEAETYNLVVADFHTYFVGDQKLLSHDNTVRRTTTTTVPGLKAD